MQGQMHPMLPNDMLPPALLRPLKFGDEIHRGAFWRGVAWGMAIEGFLVIAAVVMGIIHRSPL